MIASRTAPLASLALGSAAVLAPTADAAVVLDRSSDVLVNLQGVVTTDQTTEAAVPSGPTDAFVNESSASGTGAEALIRAASARESNGRFFGVSTVDGGSGFRFFAQSGFASASLSNQRRSPARLGDNAASSYDLDLRFEVPTNSQADLELTGSLLLTGNTSMSPSQDAASARLSTYAYELVQEAAGPAPDVLLASGADAFTGFDRDVVGGTVPSFTLNETRTLGAGIYRLSLDLDASVLGIAEGVNVSNGGVLSAISAQVSDLELRVVSTPVPEPASAALAAAGLALLARRRR